MIVMNTLNVVVQMSWEGDINNKKRAMKQMVRLNKTVIRDRNIARR